MGARSYRDDRLELTRLIEAVRVAVPAVRAAAARIEGIDRGQVAPVLSSVGVVQDSVGDSVAGSVQSSLQDAAVVDRWLADLARIAVLVCDQPHPISKELGARLDTVSSGLGAYLHLG